MQSAITSTDMPLAEATSTPVRKAKRTSSDADLRNPYLAARASWDERYGDLIARARHWRMAAFVFGAIAFVAVGGLILESRRSRLVPFVVAVNELGRPIASGVAHGAADGAPLDDRVIKAALADFVADWRGVTIDWNVQRGQIDNVFARIGQGSPAQTAISDWYRAEPPQKKAEQGTVEIEVKAVLATPGGDKHWEVDWTEVRRAATGQLTGREHFKGLFQIAVNPPSTEQDARLNPLGFFITNATWSRVFEKGEGK